MKKAFRIKIAALATMFAVLAFVMVMPAFSFAGTSPSEQIADDFDYDKPVDLPVSVKVSALSNMKSPGDEYELPFISAETKHDWDNGTVTTPPTCTQKGVKTYTCKINPNHTYTEEIPATGHTLSEPVVQNEVAPTCEAAGGRDEVVFCSVCHTEISRTHIEVPKLGHDWGEWVCTVEPTDTLPGEEKRTCKNDSSHTQTREIPPLGSGETQLSFFDGEIIIIVPKGAIPVGAEFDVQKIVPPPQEVVSDLKEQMGDSSEVIAYYEIRLTDAESASIIHLDGEITVKFKMPEQYRGSESVHCIQKNETGKLIIMNSFFEDGYLCYNTDWLEIYD